jgi:pimeloyl-ACP methyl ester carboxylesterase
MWVDAARRWGVQGVTSLRLDLEGIGDADGDETRYADVGQLYDPHLVDEAAAALRALSENRPGTRFILVGLCSGAYWAFHAARRLPEVAATIMLNPRQLYYDPAIDVRREAQRASRGAVSASRLRRLFTGRVSPALVLRLARSAVVSVFLRRAHRRALERSMRQVRAGFDDVRGAGVRGLLVFSEGEPLLAELREDGIMDELGRWPWLECWLIRGPGHTFRPVWAQQRVHDRIDRLLDEELRRPPAEDAPAPVDPAPLPS